MKLKIWIFTLVFTVLTSHATPFPKNLISLESPSGTKIFEQTSHQPYFWRIMSQFVSQKNQTYCSIASSVMVLNALKADAPTDPLLTPYKMFTQDNFFTPAVTKIISPELVSKKGSTLQKISDAVATFNVNVTTVHANTITVEKFRTLASEAIQNHTGYVIVNFLRTGLGQEGAGHMSPLAAYDKKTDRFLMLDVARYRYPSVWVKSEDLYNAMNTQDSDSKKSRGFLIIRK